MAVGPSPDLSGNLPTDECCIDNECCEDSIECPETEPVGSRPKYYLYAACIGVVNIIDTATNTVTATISGLGNYIPGIALNPKGSRLYTTEHKGYPPASTLHVIDTADNSFVGSLELDDNNSLRLAVSPDGKRIYVTNYTSPPKSKIWVVDISSDSPSLIGTVAVGSAPLDVKISPDGNRVFVMCEGGLSSEPAHVAVVDAGTLSIVATINLPMGTEEYGRQLAVTPDGSRVYATTTQVGVIATSSNTLIATVAIPYYKNPSSMAISPDGRSCYVRYCYADELAVISTTTNEVVKVISGLGGQDSNTGTDRTIVSPDGTTVFCTIFSPGPIGYKPAIARIDTVANKVVALIDTLDHCTDLAIRNLPDTSGPKNCPS